MLTKTDQVKAAIHQCDLWYLSRNRNIRTLTERIEAMWYEVNFHVARMELAERDGNTVSMGFHQGRITHFVTCIYAEAGRTRER